MRLYEQIQAVKAQQEMQRAKRKQSNEEDKKDKDVARPTKKAAISEVIQAQRSGTGIPIEELTAYPEAFSFESAPASKRRLVVQVQHPEAKSVGGSYPPHQINHLG